MKSDTSIKITYYRGPKRTFEGIEEFDKVLDEHYIYANHVKVAEDLGGSGNGIFVEILSNIDLKDILNGVMGGGIYDLIKNGSKAFLLKPFITAYNNLKVRNNDDLDIEELVFNFKDSIIVIERVSENTIINSLDKIFEVLAQRYNGLILAGGEKPFKIIIPVFKEEVEKDICNYRVYLGEDEVPQNKDEKSYFFYWGLYYNLHVKYVYDVILDKIQFEEYLNFSSYFAAINERYSQKNK